MWVPRPGAHTSQMFKGRCSEVKLHDSCEVGKQEHVRCGAQCEYHKITEELRALRTDLACQRRQLQIQKAQLEIQHRRLETIATEARDARSRDRPAVNSDIESEHIKVGLAQPGRSQKEVDAECERRFVETHALRELVKPLVEERVMTASDEERTARLKQISEMHSTILSRLDEHWAALLEHMRGLASDQDSKKTPVDASQDHMISGTIGCMAKQDHVEMGTDKPMFSSELARRIASLGKPQAMSVDSKEQCSSSGHCVDFRWAAKNCETVSTNGPGAGGFHCFSSELAHKERRDALGISSRDISEQQSVLPVVSHTQKSASVISEGRCGSSAAFHLESIAEDMTRGSSPGDGDGEANSGGPTSLTTIRRMLKL